MLLFLEKQNLWKNSFFPFYFHYFIKFDGWVYVQKDNGFIPSDTAFWVSRVSFFQTSEFQLHATKYFSLWLSHLFLLHIGGCATRYWIHPKRYRLFWPFIAFWSHNWPKIRSKYQTIIWNIPGSWKERFKNTFFWGYPTFYDPSSNRFKFCALCLFFSNEQVYFSPTFS